MTVIRHRPPVTGIIHASMTTAEAHAMKAIPARTSRQYTLGKKTLPSRRVFFCPNM
jgi:hypothetical protein